MSFLSSVGSILVGGAALASAVKGGGSEGKSSARLGKEQSQYAFDLVKAATQPDHPLFVALQNAERERARKDFISGLEDVWRSHRRDVARGGPGYITSPDRRDEMMWSALAKQKSLDDPAARARAALQSGAGLLYNNPAYTSLAQSNVGQTQRDVLSAGVEGAGTVLGGIDTLFQNRPTVGSRPTVSSGTGQSLPVRLK